MQGLASNTGQVRTRNLKVTVVLLNFSSERQLVDGTRALIGYFIQFAHMLISLGRQFCIELFHMSQMTLENSEKKITKN